MAPLLMNQNPTVLLHDDAALENGRKQYIYFPTSMLWEMIILFSAIFKFCTTNQLFKCFICCTLEKDKSMLSQNA